MIINHVNLKEDSTQKNPIQRADRLKIQNPRQECTSVFLGIWKRQRVVAPRSPLKKKDSFSCRHCFPVFSRAAPEWLYHFRSSGRHFDSYAHIMDCRALPKCQHVWRSSTVTLPLSDSETSASSLMPNFVLQMTPLHWGLFEAHEQNRKKAAQGPHLL